MSRRKRDGMARRSVPGEIRMLGRHGVEQAVAVVKAYENRGGDLVLVLARPGGRIENVAAKELVQTYSNLGFQLKSQLDMLKAHPGGIPEQAVPSGTKPLWDVYYRLMTRGPFEEKARVSRNQYLKMIAKRITTCDRLRGQIAQLVEFHRAGLLDCSEVGGVTAKRTMPLKIAAEKCRRTEVKAKGRKTRLAICREFLQTARIEGKSDYTPEKLAQYIATALAQKKL